MITHRYDIVTGRQDSAGKTHWTRVGVAFPSKDGSDSFSIKLEAYPLPNEKGDVWVRAFPPKDRDAQRGVPRPRGLGGSPPKSDDGMDGDDIPF